MSTTRARPQSTRGYSDGAAGLIVFAAVIMMIAGVLHAIQGLVALVNDTFYVVGEEYIFTFDLTTWGWVHLLLGILVAVAGFFLLQAATWARIVAIGVVSLSIIANFVWLPYYPFWSMMTIAFGVAVIWALSLHGRDVLGE